MVLNKAERFVDRDFFQSATTLFKITGLWRVDNQSKWLDLLWYFNRFNVFFTFGWAFTASVLSGCYLYFMDGETEKAFIWITFSLTYSFIQFKFFMLATKEFEIRKIIRKLEKFSSQYSDKTHIEKSLKTSEKLMVIGSLMIGGACVGYVIIPVAFNYRKVLPIRTMFTYGMDVFKSPIYEFFIIYQMLGTVCHTVIAMVFDMTYVGFLLCSASLLNNINTDLKKLLLQINLSPEEKHRQLIRHIKSHIEIFEFLNEIKALFMESNMLHFSYNYLSAGLTMFQVSRQAIGSIKFFSLISGCGSCVFGLVCYCEAGQKITDEMHIFWQNLFFSDWYEQPVNYRRSIIFVSLVTQKDYYMLAGKLMTLSRETEKKIIQAIFTYYTFLLQFNT